MVLKISSKFEVRRFCRTTGAVAMLKLCQPNPDDLGYVTLSRSRKLLVLGYVKNISMDISVFRGKVIDVIAANTNDMGPLSLDFFRKNNLSASWKVIGEKTSITDKINFTAVDTRQETPKVKVDVSSGGDHAQLVDPAKLARRVTVVKNEEGGNSVSTVLLRGSIDSILDDLERAVDDKLNTYKMSKPLELVCYSLLKKQWFCILDQYAIAKFAESFEMVPQTLVENAGLNAMEIISSLYAEHASGNTKVGLDLEEGRCKDVSTLNI
ncbi:unnamed protein product [Prunus armeniaca]|uniref:T-complex protein 1 subunit theta n=1 Tax=Prunus armeniaca TaxID=36596 RepID=A0A6J5UD49_PRUAR|nr:unnamed protein product [Prunus armeniaca]